METGTKSGNMIQIITRHSCALACGYLAWLLLYTYVPITEQYMTPISFFNLPETCTVEAPETIITTLTAPRIILDTMTPTIHIDADNIPLNTAFPYHIDRKNLLMPYPVDMVHCYPSAITIVKKQIAFV